MLCLSIPTPGYYILGANLGSLLQGGVSVMYDISFKGASGREILLSFQGGL